MKKVLLSDLEMLQSCRLCFCFGLQEKREYSKALRSKKDAHPTPEG
jgi:hypothetical protein